MNVAPGRSSLSYQVVYGVLELGKDVVYSPINDLFSFTSEGSVESFALSLKVLKYFPGGNRGLSAWLLCKRDFLQPVPPKFLPGSNSESLTPTGCPTIQSNADIN